MSIYLAYYCGESEDKLQSLVFDNAIQDVMKYADVLGQVDKEFQSFANTSRGEPIFANGGYGCIKISPDFLKEIPALVEKLQKSLNEDIAIGIGADMKQSVLACALSLEKYCGSKAVMYQPETEQELSEFSDDEEENSDESDDITKAEGDSESEAPIEEPVAGPDEEVKQLIANSLQLVTQQKGYIESIKNSNPQAYEAIKSIVQSMIVMAQSMLSEPPTAEGESEAGVEQPQDIPAPGETQKSENDIAKANVMPAPKIMAPRRKSGKGPRRRLVVGSVKNGKRKIIDPMTGKSKWAAAAPKK